MPTRNEVRAAGKIIHEHGVAHGWFGPHNKKTFEELESSDPMSFREFNDIIHTALDAAEKS